MHTDQLFPKGDKAPANYFTGDVSVNILVPKDETGTFAIGDVQFEPGCRTNWHTHPAGQILLVTEGSGYYQEKGQPARIIRKGDVVVIPNSVVHWHGASADSHLTHIAITNFKDGTNATWLEPVSEEDYSSLPKI